MLGALTNFPPPLPHKLAVIIFRVCKLGDFTNFEVVFSAASTKLSTWEILEVEKKKTVKESSQSIVLEQFQRGRGGAHPLIVIKSLYLSVEWRRTSDSRSLDTSIWEQVQCTSRKLVVLDNSWSNDWHWRSHHDCVYLRLLWSCERAQIFPYFGKKLLLLF